MKRFARMLFAGLGIVIAGSAMSLVPHKAATAGPVSAVTVTNVPLPVTQSGPWNVGITGTPSVNANVTFPASQGVTVTAPGPLTHLGRLPSKQVMLLLSPVGSQLGCASETAQVNIDGTVSCFDMANHPGEALVITDLMYTFTATVGSTCTANVGSLSNNQIILPLQATAAADGNAVKSEHLIAGLTMTFTPTLLTVNGACSSNGIHAQGYLLPNH